MRVRMHVYVCVHRFVYVYTQINSSILEYVKICHRNGKHPSLKIFDKHLVEQTNQGLPQILEQYLLK